MSIAELPAQTGEIRISGVDDKWAAMAVASGLDTLALDPLKGKGDRFVGQSLPMPKGRVFGGQLLAQSVMAAGLTVDTDRDPHSMHMYFLKAGDTRKPIHYDVERLSDGRSLSARRVHATQDGETLLSMIASFSMEKGGADHTMAMPKVPDPRSLTSLIDVLAPYPEHPISDFWLANGPFDIRHVEGSLFLDPDGNPKSYQYAWMKVRQDLNITPLMHRALIAFGCDQVMLEPMMRRHGASWTTRGFAFATLDHAMWWHRPARADEWLLFVQDTPTSQGGRGLSQAKVFNESGVLVASIAQEDMFKVPGH